MHYLPADFKALVDLSQITIEKESFVEDELKRKLTNLLYSVKTKNQEKAFVYVNGGTSYTRSLEGIALMEIHTFVM